MGCIEGCIEGAFIVCCADKFVEFGVGGDVLICMEGFVERISDEGLKSKLVGRSEGRLEFNMDTDMDE